MTRNLWTTTALLSLAAAISGCGGGGGTGPGGTTGVALKIYQNAHPAAGYVDANGGLRTNIRPGQLEAYGGSPLSGYTWTVTTGTSMPFPGLTISPLTGLVSGTLPAGTAPGTYNYRVTVSDGSTTYSSSGAYIQVNACNSSGAGGAANCNIPPSLNCASGSLSDMNLGGIASWKAGEPVGYSLFVSGGAPPYKNWTVLTGSLPPGLSLDASRGVLHGTALSSAAGNTYTFTVRVSDNANTLCPSGGSSPATYRITLE